jgi:hypothetical protein
MFEHVAERVIRQTDRGIAPWYLMEAEDTRYRDLTVGKTLLQAIRAARPARCMEPPTPPDPLQLPESASAQITLLDQLDLTKLDRERLQGRAQEAPAGDQRAELEAYKQRAPLCWCSRASMPAARAAPSAASPAPWTPASTAPCRWPRRRTRKRPITICGASGDTSRAPDT